VELDGSDVLLNSMEGRVKPRNVRRDPRIALSILNPNDPYHNVSVRGRVVEITNAGAEDGIDRLARKYIGTPNYPFRQPGERRVQFRVRPESIGGQAGERPRSTEDGG
jgi:PPOX class probable F420-dependent enzyme